MGTNRRNFIKFVVAGSVTAGCPIDLSLLAAQTDNKPVVEGVDNRICHQVRDGKAFARPAVSARHDIVIVGGGVSGLSAAYLLVFDPGQPLRVLYRVGDGIGSLHGTSAGKALLGSLDDRALDAFLKSAKLLPITERTITSKAALRKEIELGKERRWFLNRGETLNDVMSVSSPFRWNSAIYIVTVAGPSSRLDGRLEEVVPLLTGVCRRLEMGPDVK